MKKFLIFILTLICLAAIGLGVYAIVKPDKTTAETGDVVCAVDTLKDGNKYVIGEKIGYRVRATSDIEITKVYYGLLNGEKVETEARHGLSKNFDDLAGEGKYALDTGTQTIDTKDLKTGWYVIQFYIETAEGETYIAFDKPLMFEITEESKEEAETPETEKDTQTENVEQS